MAIINDIAPAYLIGRTMRIAIANFVDDMAANAIVGIQVI